MAVSKHPRGSSSSSFRLSSSDDAYMRAYVVVLGRERCGQVGLPKPHGFAGEAELVTGERAALTCSAPRLSHSRSGRQSGQASSLVSNRRCRLTAFSIGHTTARVQAAVDIDDEGAGHAISAM